MSLIVSAAVPAVATGTSLGVQLLAALLLLVVVVVIHGAGIVGVTKLLRLEDRSLRAHRVDFKAFGLLTSIAIWLFALHLLEICVFALFYLSVGAIDRLEAALYFSISAYSTLGQTDLHFPTEWRILGAIEGVVGFLMIGWSTAISSPTSTNCSANEPLRNRFPAIASGLLYSRCAASLAAPHHPP